MITCPVCRSRLDLEVPRDRVGKGWKTKVSLCESIVKKVTFKSGTTLYAETVDDIIQELESRGYLKYEQNEIALAPPTINLNRRNQMPATPKLNEAADGGLRTTALFGCDDPRLAILRKGPTNGLTALVEEILDTEKFGCSLAYFALGMAPEFRQTEPAEMMELIFHVLRERLPNASAMASADTQTPPKETTL